jgi:hypothetical protein
MNEDFNIKDADPRVWYVGPKTAGLWGPEHEYPWSWMIAFALEPTGYQEHWWKLPKNYDPSDVGY